ncbi:MAG: PD40 domain-containing protein [Anaerolineales bacterium]|nr:PD40 domain-containing protein [Anaerolineales bacterium]
MFRKIIFLTLTFIFLLTACLPVGQIQVDIETPAARESVESPTETVAPDVIPNSTETPAPTEEPSAALAGTVTGRVCYPSEVIPAMNAFFRNVHTGALTELAIAENQSEYSLELEVGTYEAFAYLQAGDLGGAYSQAVLCGLTIECLDHSLLTFDVQTGQTSTNIDLCDWYEPLAVPVNPRATLVADPALAGLVYLNMLATSLWRVDATGSATPALAQGDMGTVVSPDGTQALYFKNDDVWLGDLTTGTWRNLTNTPDRVEYPAFWVPGTDWVGLSSHNPAESDGLPMWQLTFVRLDGSGYEVVDPGAMWGVPAASPDGVTVAYDVDGAARLYRIGSGVEGFDPAQYGLTGVEKISAPAFSPDGKQLAWWVSGPLNGGNTQVALAVFALEAGTVTLIHPYTPISGEGFSNPVWSPDGQWLASNVIGDGSRSALWVFKADGSEEHLLGDGAQPVWSPASNALLFITWGSGPAYEGALNRVVLGDWGIAPLSLPLGSFPLAWKGES